MSEVEVTNIIWSIAIAVWIGVFLLWGFGSQQKHPNKKDRP